jgi:hypothetical protein
MDFHQGHQAAMKLAGTVALPSPFPAFGSVSIVVAPDDGDHETYLRIVQHVTGKRIITRFVKLADVRAIRAPATSEAQGSPDTWELIGPKEIGRRIAKHEKGLRATASKSGDSSGADWLPAAIVYVPETASVLHRNDVAVTAAVSAEDVAFSAHGLQPIHHCLPEPTPFSLAAKASWCPGGH